MCQVKFPKKPTSRWFLDPPFEQKTFWYEKKKKDVDQETWFQKLKHLVIFLALGTNGHNTTSPECKHNTTFKHSSLAGLVFVHLREGLP